MARENALWLVRKRIAARTVTIKCATAISSRSREATPTSPPAIPMRSFLARGRVAREDRGRAGGPCGFSARWRLQPGFTRGTPGHRGATAAARDMSRRFHHIVPRDPLPRTENRAQRQNPRSVGHRSIPRVEGRRDRVPDAGGFGRPTGHGAAPPTPVFPARLGSAGLDPDPRKLAAPSARAPSRRRR
jgi:hypothetical protein